MCWRELKRVERELYSCQIYLIEYLRENALIVGHIEPRSLYPLSHLHEWRKFIFSLEFLPRSFIEHSNITQCTCDRNVILCNNNKKQFRLSCFYVSEPPFLIGAIYVDVMGKCGAGCRKYFIIPRVWTIFWWILDIIKHFEVIICNMEFKLFITEHQFVSFIIKIFMNFL